MYWSLDSTLQSRRNADMPELSGIVASYSKSPIMPIHPPTVLCGWPFRGTRQSTGAAAAYAFANDSSSTRLHNKVLVNAT